MVVLVYVPRPVLARRTPHGPFDVPIRTEQWFQFAFLFLPALLWPTHLPPKEAQSSTGSGKSAERCSKESVRQVSTTLSAC